MAPPNSFYVPVNHGGQQSVDDFDTYSVKNRIVNSVHEIVDDFSKTITTTFATINDEDNNDIGDFLRPVDSAVNAISGNQGTDYPDVGSTVVQETANNIFNDVTTEIHRFTDFFNGNIFI